MSRAVVLDYEIVDVFTEHSLAGNQLAVVMPGAALTSEQMQAIAREFNLSETTFVERRSNPVERSEGVRVRVFTTQEELPFAGHPTLGTASVLMRLAPEAAIDDTITLALNVGPVPVRFTATAEGSHALFGEMTQRDPEFFEELDPDEVAPLLGLSADDLTPTPPPQVVSTGAAFAVVLLNSLSALERLSVRQAESGRFLKSHSARWFYVLAPSEERGIDFRARMQFYGGEDPATGSAAGCAVSYLVRHGIVDSSRRIAVKQGVEIVRPSMLFLSAAMREAKVCDVRVGGSTVPVAKGQLFLP